MLGWSLLFLVVAVIAAAFGFGPAAAGTLAWIARILSFVFLVLFLAGLVMGLARRRPPPL